MQEEKLEKRGRTGTRRLWNAFRYSMAGLRSALRDEAAFRQEIALCLLLVPLGLWLGRDGVERAILISVLLLVPIVELLNTAVESVVDRISAEQHFLSKRAKDLGSAAVFLSLVNVLITWVLVIYSHLT
jgi:diacylglycerol kinase (ATP)